MHAGCPGDCILMGSHMSWQGAQEEAVGGTRGTVWSSPLRRSLLSRVETMRPLLALVLFVAGLCPAVFCHPDTPPKLETPTLEGGGNEVPVDGLRLASSNTDFAFSLYRQLASEAPNKNIIFSPLSVSTALAFASLGARNSTLTEILQGLRFNLTETPEPEIHRGFRRILSTLRRPDDRLKLRVGNALFIDEQLRLLANFTERARDLYAAEAFTANFQDPKAAEQLINDFVKRETEGKISELAKDLDQTTVLVLVNYILFKGASQSRHGSEGSVLSEPRQLLPSWHCGVCY